MRPTTSHATLLALVVTAGCADDGAPPEPPDAGPLVECTEDVDCDDGFYCSGAEVCSDGTCEAGVDPCLGASLCDEDGERCVEVLDPCAVPDADGDGRARPECGGDDCDDADADRYPGNVERCDDRDQDCDPETVGEIDADGDGATSSECCNGNLCGPDCDDAAPGVGPTATETCDEIDNDCDGHVDEGVLRAFHPDEDGDNFGSPDGAPIFACARPEGTAENALDCDDGSAIVNPTALEACDLVDNDCNGRIDDEAATQLACTLAFGTPPRTFFGCVAGECRVTACAEGFADCNGEPSDGCEIDTRRDLTHCGACDNYCGVGGECDGGACDSVVDVAAGYRHTCVARSNGVVACWGDNDFGQLGDISTTARAEPVRVGTVGNAADVETHPFPTTVEDECPFTCARTTDPLVYCWGCDRFGNKGDGEGEERGLVPEPVTDVPRAVGGALEPLAPVLAVGGAHGCVASGEALADRTVLCWGSTADGRIGDAICADDVCPPVELPDLPAPAAAPAVDAVTGDRHTCVLDAAGRAFCLGDNAHGQLGDGGLDGSDRPVAVTGGHAFDSLSAGMGFTCGLRSDGAVLCWGLNAEGQLGDGRSVDRSAPTPVAGLRDAVGVSAGAAHACAWLADGTARCWGGGGRGQLGHGAAAGSATPVRVDGLDRILQVSCGGRHTCALRDDGDVWCWGANDRWQLGDGTLVDRAVPVRAVGT